MSLKIKVIVSVVALVVAFACGRWLAPTKIKTETKIVEVEKKTKDTDQSKTRHKKVVIVEITKPDGTKQKTTTITDDTETEKKTSQQDDKNTQTDTTKEVSRSAARTTINVLGGVPIIGGSIIYGAQVTRDIIGPINIGLWGMSNATVGASVGVSF